jgi:hypothetical protein
MLMTDTDALPDADRFFIAELVSETPRPGEATVVAKQ